MLLLMSCSGKNRLSANPSPIRTDNLLKRHQTGFRKVHSLKKKDNTFIGDIYAKFINDSIFTDLYVINKSDTLYTIKRNTLFNKGGKDIEVYSDGFYGYLFVLKKNDYFVLSYLTKNGANVSDDITIEWSYDKNILEYQKTP